MKTRTFRPQLEFLEQRLPLSANLPEAPLPEDSAADPIAEVSPEPDASTSDVEIIDPTLDPVDPANTTVMAQVVSLGATVNGEIQSITVQGLSASGLDFALMQVQLGDTLYDVDFITIQDNGDVTLTMTTGIDPNDVAIGDSVLITTGDGGTTAIPDDPAVETPPADPPPDVPPVDPTLDPVG